MCICICICIYICACFYACICVYIYVCICIILPWLACLLITATLLYLCLQLCLYLCLYLCLHLYLYLFLCLFVCLMPTGDCVTCDLKSVDLNLSRDKPTKSTFDASSRHKANKGKVFHICNFQASIRI